MDKFDGRVAELFADQAGELGPIGEPISWSSVERGIVVFLFLFFLVFLGVVFVFIAEVDPPVLRGASEE